MQLKEGDSEKVVSYNISELHRGRTFARTAKKYGKKKADAQAVAIALEKARESRRKKY